MNLKCKLCQYEAKQLHQHLRSVHGITANEYRALFEGSERMQINFAKFKSKEVNRELAQKTKKSRMPEKNILHNEQVTTLSKEETRQTLLEADLHKTLTGKSIGRVLFKSNPSLYKSIMIHTQELEQEVLALGCNPTSYSMVKRVEFIVGCNYNLDKAKCKCKKKLNFRKYCRECNETTAHYNQIHSEETLKKIRVSTLRYLETIKGQIAPRYNTHSISIIDQLAKELGYNFQHAENGGEFYIKELGYWLDAYDNSKNVVLEVLEKHHFKRGVLRKKDITREREIQEYLTKVQGVRCTFLKYDYENKQLI